MKKYKLQIEIRECMYTEKLSQSYYRVGRSMPCLCLSESILGAWTTIGVHFPLRRDIARQKNHIIYHIKQQYTFTKISFSLFILLKLKKVWIIKNLDYNISISNSNK